MGVLQNPHGKSKGNGAAQLPICRGPAPTVTFSTFSKNTAGLTLRWCDALGGSGFLAPPLHEIRE